MIYSQKSTEEPLNSNYYGNFVCSRQGPLFHFYGCKLGYLFLERERLELSRLSWQPNHRFHFVCCLIYFPCAKFTENHANISRDI